MVVGEREDASEESEERSSALLVVLVRYTGWGWSSRWRRLEEAGVGGVLGGEWRRHGRWFQGWYAARRLEDSFWEVEMGT
jgi:hypothetical protein